MLYKPRKAECSKCGKPKPTVRSAYCRDCRNLMARAYRRAKYVPTVEQVLKSKARSLAKGYADRGHFDVSACGACGGAQEIELHHPDYAKPLEVVALCRTCHRKVHEGVISIEGVPVQRHVQKKDLPPNNACSSKCGRERRPGGRLCRECHAAKMRQWRSERVFVKKAVPREG